ncbi:MAG TPA: hypothetical protein VH437_17475 [Terriglobales bacterium]
MAKVIIASYWIFGVYFTLDAPVALLVGVPEYLHHSFDWTRRLKSYPGCVPSCSEEHARRFETEADHFESFVDDSQGARLITLYCVVIFFGLTAGRLKPGRWKLELVLAALCAFCIVTCQECVFLSISDYLTVIRHDPPALFLPDGSHPNAREIIVYALQRSINQLAFGFLDNYGFKISDVSARSGSAALATGITVFDYLVPVSVYGIYGFMKVSRRLSAWIMGHLRELAT